ncbi:hypothetical protein HGM15179_012505 [Zosterops borbonicus]|uniref:Uncharacterized protein n=1 Tax=Zosterops borbonicus TaxID=364589 RepID=A0A8K1GAE6_9PASS|nr:hypothetical protein HGM15179_012505 [Zosterops borbonicus]
MDYVLKVLALLEAQAAFFSRGHQGATETREYRARLGAQLERGELEGARRRRDLEQRHHLLLQQDLSQEEVGVASEGAGPVATPIEGYLYKRARNAFRTWSRSDEFKVSLTVEESQWNVASLVVAAVLID